MTTTLTAVPYSYDQTVRTNQATNPSVENDTTGWGLFAGTGGVAALSRQVGHVISGVQVSGYYLRGTWTTGSTAIGGGLYHVVPGIIAGQSYSLGIYFRCSKAQRLGISVDWLTAGSVLISQTPRTAVISPAGQWSRHAVENVIAPATATQARVTFYAIAGTSATTWASGDTLDADYFLAEQAATLGPYFDGDTPDAVIGFVDHAWTGTAHASTSTRTARTPSAAAVQATPGLVLDYAAEQESTTVLHQIIGREDLLPAIGVMGRRAGELEVWCATHADALAVTEVYAHAGYVLLQDTADPGLDMYHLAQRVRVTPAAEQTPTRRWLVRVEYTEVDRTETVW